MLKSLGYVPGREDGYFSKETESALKAFQNANEMEATGQLDKKTAEAIQTKIIEKFVLEKMITITVSIKINGKIRRNTGSFLPVFLC